jgi:carbon storage regulator CsrA
MLVLTRKIQESLVIGEDITITVVAIRGNIVSLVITAPSTLAINCKDRGCSEQAVGIGQDVEIIVVGICRNRARIGIIAPGQMAVRREDLHEFIVPGENVRLSMVEVLGPLMPSFGGEHADDGHRP